MSRRKKQRKAATPPCNPPHPYLYMFGLLVVIFLFTAMVTFSSEDPPNPNIFPAASPVHNACGKVGAWVAYHGMRLLGIGVYPLLILAGGGLLFRLSGRTINLVLQRSAAVAVLMTAAASSAFILWPEGTLNLPTGRGGALGQLVGGLMRDNFSGFGTLLVVVYCVLAALIFLFEGLWSRIQRGAEQGARMGAGVLGVTRNATVSVIGASVQGLMKVPSIVTSIGSAGKGLKGRLTSYETVSDRSDKKQLTAPDRSHVDDDEPPVTKRPDPPVDDKTTSRDKKSAAVGKSQQMNIIFRSNQPAEVKPEGCYPATLDDWILPPVSLLDESDCGISEIQEEQARQKALVLENTLRDFKIEAPVVEIDTGPVISMYELKLAPGIKVSQVAALANDIARALKAPSIRVVAPIPGKNTVGIEVPRLDRERVRLQELMNATGQKAANMTLPLFLGKDASGNPMVYDLARMPHMLIAGTTGSGKSVCINSIIMSLLMTQRPDRVKFILMDPKMVELSAFKDVPHLMCPIITDMKKAEQILEWACTKMDERYALLAEAGVRNIAGFNRLTREEILERFQPSNEEEAGQIPTHLAHVVIIIDELADLMMMSAKDVEYYLARIAQKSRAVGIHVVVATQRPEAKVVTGLIKSNLPCRCAFRVAARMDSRIVLDQNGAEVLLGQGDMLFLPPGSANLIRSQGTFIDDHEIRSVVQDLRSKGKSDYHPELMQIRATSEADATERDELFDKAVEIVLETQRGSVSLLQRRLTVGYSRASRLIDQMAAAGLVGEYKGSQAREVLVTLDEWHAMKSQVESDLQQGYEADQDDFGVEEEDRPEFVEATAAEDE